MEDAITHSKKFVEDVLSFFGLNTDIKVSGDEEDMVIELSVPSTHLNGFLIGQNGDTLHSLQSLTMASLRMAGFDGYRVNLDIADYKKQQNEKIIEKAEKWAKEVHESGEDMHLNPMNAAQRRLVHKTISEYGNGLTTESEGERRDRHIVVRAP